MILFLIVALSLTSLSSFAQSGYVSIGTCKDQEATNIRILSNDFEGEYSQKNDGLVLLDIPLEGKENVITAYTAELTKIDDHTLSVTTFFGEIILKSGETTEFKPAHVGYKCKFD